MANSRRFFVLGETLPASEIPSMMCRVVTDKTYPQHKYAPFPPSPGREPCQTTDTIIPDITGPPQIALQRREFLENVKGTEFLTNLTSFFGIDVGREDIQTLELQSAEVKRYTLSNADVYFNQLMHNELYARDVADILESSPHTKAYLVTGFLTTTGAVWKTSTGRSRTAGFTVTAPISELVGLPIPGLDPSVSPSWTRAQNQEREMTIVDEEIFAVAYSEVRFSRSFNKTAPKFTKKLPVVGPPKRAKAHHLALGPDEDEEIQESSDDEDESEITEQTAARVVLGPGDWSGQDLPETFVLDK